MGGTATHRAAASDSASLLPLPNLFEKIVFGGISIEMAFCYRWPVPSRLKPKFKQSVQNLKNIRLQNPTLSAEG